MFDGATAVPFGQTVLMVSALIFDFSHADHTVPTLEHVNLDDLPGWPRRHHS